MPSDLILSFQARSRIIPFLALIAAFLWWAAAAPAQDTPTPVPSKRPADEAAAKFMRSCAGCHTLSGIKLNGPALNTAATWPEPDLKTAIKRMEKNAGPLDDATVSLLAAFIKAPDATVRLQAETERLASLFAAQLEPPSADEGRRLFFGKHPLKNGGLQCSACHSAGGLLGGNLGPDLSPVHARLGNLPLISAIEKSSFKIMEPHYRRHPVSRQEAMHLAKFLSTINSQNPPPQPPPYLVWGAGGAATALAGLVFFFGRLREAHDRPLLRRRR